MQTHKKKFLISKNMKGMKNKKLQFISDILDYKT